MAANRDAAAGTKKVPGQWQFVGGSSQPGHFPRYGLPEIAFAGKSNVGKSSLINCLTRVRGLARTSSTPGRTQQINFFERTGELIFADLPGYGYAKVSRAQREAWKPLVESYLESREELRGVVVLVDLRRGLSDEDAQLMAFAVACGRQAVVVATKVDKLKSGERLRQSRALLERTPRVLFFSAHTGEGAREVWQQLAELAGLR